MDLRKSIRYGGLLGVLAVALWFKYGYEPGYQPGGRIDRIAIEPPPDNNDRWAMPTPEEVHGIARDAWAAPESDWRAREKADAESALVRYGSELLIVPVQGDENAFDPVERSLMTWLISDRIQRGTGYRVVNPTAVERYLGAHRATFAESDIATLAKTISASGVLSLHAHHDRNGGWMLTATLHDGDFGAELESKTWQGLAYSDEAPPVEALASILEEVVEFAAKQSSNVATDTPKLTADDYVFPETVEQLMARSTESALHSAAYLQLIAALHPRGEFNEERNRLYVRSLVELQRVSPRAPFYRYFKARAYANLSRRPAALAALGTPKNDHERVLLEALNGNLPELSEIVADTDASALSFLMFKDYQRIREYYSRDAEEPIERFAGPNPNWAPFIQRSIRDYDDWARYSAATVKMGLDLLMPNKVVSLETEFSGRLAVGDVPDELEIARLVWRHIDGFGDKAKDWQRREDSHVSVSPLDILELAKTTTVANHVRAVQVHLSSRDLPDAALRDIAEFAPIFEGHPEVKMIEAKALDALANKSTGAEKERLQTKAAAAYLTGYAWSRPLTTDGAEVARNYAKYLGLAGSPLKKRPSGAYAHYSRRYFEWPVAHGWFTKFYSSETAAMQTCVDYTWVRFSCVRFLVESESKYAADPAAVREAVLAENAHRFNGHPYKVEFDIEHARTAEDPDAELKLLKAQIDAGSSDWSMYYALGRIHKRRGDYRRAQDVWLSYPEFRQTNGQVLLGAANDAGLAGAMLYWIGQHELAAPLLEISAASNAGGGETMSARARLALIEGDLETAAEWSAARVRRYQSQYGLRDLLQILHITGQSELAWQVFDQVQSSVQSTPMWSGALVGHRVAGATLADISEWLAAVDHRHTAIAKGIDGSSIDLAQRYLMLSGVMDRVPDSGFVAAIAEAPTQNPPIYSSAKRRIATEDGTTMETIGIVRYGDHAYWHDRFLPKPQNEQVFDRSSKTATRLEMISEAMHAFLNEDHASAYELFNNTAYFYYLDEFLPYHAYSASILNDADHIREALRQREFKLEQTRREEDFDSSDLGYRYDEDLTYAVLAAFDGDHDEAIDRLNAALNNRPYLNDRTIFPMYQLVDLADRLYEKTDEPAYKKFALDLSRRHTVILPMYAWAYFVVAKHSDSSLERRNSAASGLWLDPQSDRGSRLPKELKSEAQRLLETSGPPFLRNAGRSMNSGV